MPLQLAGHVVGPAMASWLCAGFVRVAEDVFGVLVFAQVLPTAASAHHTGWTRCLRDPSYSARGRELHPGGGTLQAELFSVYESVARRISSLPGILKLRARA